MKAKTLIALFSCLYIGATCAIAQGPDGAAPDKGRQPQGQGGETRLLQHLLQMDDEKLANLRQTIERIEKMSPEEKKKMRERIGKIDKMPPEKLEDMRKKFDAIPREEREAMRQRWMELSSEEREAWRTKLKAASPEERKALLDEHGFIPPHPKRGQKGSRMQRPNGQKPQQNKGPRDGAAVEIKEN